MDQWFTPEDVKNQQKACPLSMGQAEAGRYTFCIVDQCMAWQWLTKDLLETTIEDGEEVPQGFEIASGPIKSGKKIIRKIIQKPTHGRCGMVPRNV